MYIIKNNVKNKPMNSRTAQLFQLMTKPDQAIIHIHSYLNIFLPSFLFPFFFNFLFGKLWIYLKFKRTVQWTSGYFHLGIQIARTYSLSLSEPLESNLQTSWNFTTNYFRAPESCIFKNSVSWGFLSYQQLTSQHSSPSRTLWKDVGSQLRYNLSYPSKLPNFLESQSPQPPLPNFSRQCADHHPSIQGESIYWEVSEAGAILEWGNRPKRALRYKIGPGFNAGCVA